MNWATKKKYLWKLFTLRKSEHEIKFFSLIFFCCQSIWIESLSLQLHSLSASTIASKIYLSIEGYVAIEFDGASARVNNFFATEPIVCV